MAEQNNQSRTEQPTPQRIEKSREKGQVAYSTDLTTGIALLVVSGALAFTGPAIWQQLMSNTALILKSSGGFARYDIGVDRVAIDSLSGVIWIALPIMLGTFFVSFVAGGMLTGFRVTFQPLKFEPEKLDPTKGFKRIFSTRSLIRGLMAIGKLIVLCTAICLILNAQADRIREAGRLQLPGSLGVAWSVVIQILLAVAALLVAMGLVDYLYQRWKHIQDLRMSRQELIDERRESDGDPNVRARIRKLQRELSQRRMINDVGTATVVVTNPTHLAVALKYDSATMSNPKVVAKGADLLAKVITAKARRHQIPIVERKPLARYLYRHVAIGHDIPVEVFQAVAEVLVYVYSLKNDSAA